MMLIGEHVLLTLPFFLHQPLQETSQIPHRILYTGKYWSPFYFRLFRPRCQRVDLRLDELQCFILSIFKEGRK